jgi:hypothetical protein
MELLREQERIFVIKDLYPGKNTELRILEGFDAQHRRAQHP